MFSAKSFKHPEQRGKLLSPDFRCRKFIKDPQHTIYLSICSKAYDDYVNDDKISLRRKKTAKVGCGDNMDIFLMLLY